jgi:hypothetical protein
MTDPERIDAGSTRANMPIGTSPSNLGAVASVRGSVVDIRFETHLPPIYSLLHTEDGKTAIEVLAQLDAHRVRGIARSAHWPTIIVPWNWGWAHASGKAGRPP